jgi:hypothetical protein
LRSHAFTGQAKTPAALFSLFDSPLAVFEKIGHPLFFFERKAFHSLIAGADDKAGQVPALEAHGSAPVRKRLVPSDIIVFAFVTVYHHPVPDSVSVRPRFPSRVGGGKVA